jgi:hypothetical protein
VRTTKRSLAVLASSLWSICASAGAQTHSLGIQVDDPRPVSEAVWVFVQRHPVVVTYEDPPFEFLGDFQDVSVAIRDPQSTVPPRSAGVLRGGILQSNYDVHADTGQPVDVAQALRNILEANDLGLAAGRFRLLQADDAFHVVPTEVRDASGVWVARPSVLDTRITVSAADRDGFALLEAILEGAGHGSGVRIAQGLVGNNWFAGYRGSIEVVNEPARDVLMGLLRAINPRFAWRLHYSPATRIYYFNSVFVAESPSPSQPTTTLPAPRPDEPTPTGRPPSMSPAL